MFSFDLQTRLRPELQPGERVLWTTSPIPKRAMIRTLSIYFFAIPWTLFALFWESMALSIFFKGAHNPMPENAGLALGVIFPIFGLPFVLMGFGMLSMPFIVYHKTKNTIYAVTDRRALIFSEFRKKELKSFSLDSLGDTFERAEKADGSGSLYFSFRKERDSEGDMRTKRLGFEDIADVKETETKLRQAIADLKAAGN